MKMKKLKYALVGVFTAAVCFCLPIEKAEAASGNFPANPIEKEGWTLDINDEFNDGVLNQDIWLPYYLPHWTASNEQAAANYSFRDGALVLSIERDTPAWNPTYDGTVKCESIQTYEVNDLHKSPTINPQPEFDGYTTKYGYFEIRAKHPVGSGGHVAWWMVGCQDEPWQNAEIDIVENVFSNTSKTQINIHAWDDPNMSGGHIYKNLGYNLGNTWHVYGFEWDPNGMKFYIDNELVGTSPETPSYRMMTFLGIYRDCGWDGYNDGIYPKEYQIDYFRVYKKNGGYDEPTLDESNLVKNATVQATSENEKLNANRLVDSNSGTEFASGANPNMPHYVTFNWEEAQEVNQVNLSSWYCKGQGPTQWEIQVSQDGQNNWTTVANSGNVTWVNNDATLETKELSFDTVSGVRGVRIKVNEANLQWGHYVIKHVYIGKTEE